MSDKILSGIGKWSAEYDENGNCTKAVYDNAYLKLLGIDSEEDATDSQNVWKADVHPDDIERIETNAIDLFSKHPDGMDYDLEYRMMTKTGYHWFHDYGLCTRRKDGSISRMDGVIFDIQDIVDKVDAQKALAENNLRILSLADDFESLYDVELETGKYDVFIKGETYDREIKSRLREINNFFDDVRTKNELLIYPEDREAVFNLLTKDEIRKVLSRQEHYDYFYRIVTDSKPIWIKIRLVYKDKDKKNVIIGVFNAENDIEAEQIAAQKVQLEKALVMAQSANRAKTTFLNSMSHDIRTPMNAIIGFTGLAASHIDNKEQVRDYLAKISQSSNHLLSLINDVLDMSRIESGKMSLNEKPENLPSLIHSLHDIILVDISHKQHKLFIDTIDVKDENIICDKLRLNQVLLNILSNSIKYTAPGGTISMHISETEKKPTGFATYEFCIKDNGMGMDAEYLKTIFDPFTRVKSSTVSGIQGTGLGMAITKNIVDMMKGRIDVQSEPGKGTQMTVSFDFKLQEVQKESIPIEELKGLKTLVADDDAQTCMSIARMLKEINMNPEWCTSGKEAVLRAEDAYKNSDVFKLYILDCLMPDMNGIETARRIRKTVGNDVPIVIMTAYDWSDIDDEAREAGITAFVSKPMFPSDLYRVLNICFGKQKDDVEKTEVICDFRGKKVLLVEDNDLNREIAFELLTEYGCLIDTATDGTVAVEKMKSAKEGDYDVILMDIQMPIMNGYEATKAIRALGTPASKIPILAMTADAFEEDRQKAIDAGMNEHIAKPININTLKETLAKYI